MTKSQESGDNEVTDEARREAARTKQDVCEILARMLAQAREAKDRDRIDKVTKAQKYFGCRNKRKRRK